MNFRGLNGRLVAVSAKHPTAKEFLNSSDPGIERGFFSRVMLPNGTFMTTHENRFSDLNSFLSPFISAFNHLAPIEVMDVAVSSGIGSEEWAHTLRSRGTECKMTATDFTICADVIQAYPWLDVLVDEQRNILHFDVGRFGFSPSTKTALKPFKLAAMKLFRMVDKPSLQSYPLPLRSKRANGVHIAKDDIFSPNKPDWINRFHVIRAANILNLGYFSPDVIRSAVETLKQRLKDRGVLVITRTLRESVNSASVFALIHGAFRVCGRLNGGSEVEDIVLAT